MSADENKEIVHRLIEEVWNQGKIYLADELFTSNFLMQDPDFGEKIRGPESFKQLVNMHRAAFPDLHMSIDEEAADEESVAICFTFSGNHVGTFMQTRPTGVHVTLTGRRLYTIVGGKIASIRESQHQVKGG